MKSKVLALLIPALLAAGAAHAAEVYNKDGNKLDLYGKVDGLHYFSDNSAKDGDQSYARLGFKGETQINDQLTGYGQWEYNIQANNTESSTNQSWTRLAFAGLKFADYGSFDYGRNYGVMYDIEGWTDMLPEFLRPAVSFLMSKGRDLHAAGGADNPAGVDDKDLVKYADVGATYYFNKNMSTYVDYKINLLDEDDSFYAANGISTDDIVALGLVYQF
ncbi:TPA: porin [Escherichia coli]